MCQAPRKGAYDAPIDRPRRRRGATNGSALIVADAIVQRLAISLVFGLASSTALTLLAIPAIYVWLRDDGRPGENLGSTPANDKETL